MMTSYAGSLLARLLRDCRGTMVIETAIVAPVLIVLSIGAFEISSIVARHSELQSAAAEAVAIVMAATPENQVQIEQIEAVMENSTGIPEVDVSFAIKVRCGTDNDLTVRQDLTPDPALCGGEDRQSWFLAISMTDRYDPVWAKFGMGEQLVYNVQRMVQLS